MIELVGSKYCINPCYFVINEMRLMLRLGFKVMLVHVKKSCQGYSKTFVQKLHGNFLNYELMLALVVIYLNLWLTTPIMFRIFSSIIHYIIKVAYYCESHNMGKDGISMKSFLDGHALDLQIIFKR